MLDDAFRCLVFLSAAARNGPPICPGLGRQGFFENVLDLFGSRTTDCSWIADFSLIAFHFQKSKTVGQDLTPVFYAVAMATGAIASLILGKLLDKLGLGILLVAFGISAFFAPLVFLHSTELELVGMVL